MEQKETSDVAVKSCFRHCYICHRPLKENEFSFFMCPECYTSNLRKREQLLVKDRILEGMIVLVTGGRIKIGYETSLSLLRKGATVMITSRFPVDAAERYSKENDFSEWANRLLIYGIDFRDIRKVEEMIKWINENLPYLNIIINNAAQTVARPEKYYRHLRKLEKAESRQLLPEIKALLKNPVETGQQDVAVKHTPSTGEIDLNGFLIDSRVHNSWVSKAWEVSTKEFLEVQLINVTTPFLLCSRLVNLLKKAPVKGKFIINVSAMEGRFSKKNKNPFHPHTNMAKAALNMMTRTIALDYRRMGIYVNSVDTGWITDENPLWIAKKNAEKGLLPPLTACDGAARICAPFLDYYYSDKKEEPVFGKFLKDYHTIHW